METITNPIAYIFIGMIVAVVKIAIEYNWWNKKKNESTFHQIGFLSVLCICIFLYCLSGYNLLCVLVFILAYWNTFEIIGNISHKQQVFYVGENASFDKLLRRITPYYEILKFIIHVITLFAVIFISLHLYHDIT